MHYLAAASSLIPIPGGCWTGAAQESWVRGGLGMSSGDQGHPQASMWAGGEREGVAEGTPEQVGGMGLYPACQAPLDAGLHHPSARGAEDEGQRTGCSPATAAPGRWQRVPLWGCKPACKWCRGGLSAPVGVALLVGDTGSPKAL